MIDNIPPTLRQIERELEAEMVWARQECERLLMERNQQDAADSELSAKIENARVRYAEALQKFTDFATRLGEKASTEPGKSIGRSA